MKRMKKLLALSLATGVLLGTVSTVSAAEVKDFFDAKYYAGRYEDLKAAYGDDEAALWEHYLTFGIKEGRSASANFDVESYRDSYPDLQKAFGSEWPAYLNHYITYGISEGRDGGGEFDAASYADRYSDLKAAFGYDYDMLYDHYQTYGQKEGRNTLSQTIMEEQMAAAYAQQNKENSGEVGGEQLPGPEQQQPDGEYREDLGDGSYVVYEVENNIRRKETYYTAGNIKESVYIYNSKGQETERTQYDTVTGEMVQKLTTTYDEAGNMLETVSYEVVSDLTVRHVYEYENGLNTQVSEYHNDVYAGKTLYTYNAQKQWIKEIRKNGYGETLGITTYEYYTSGAQKKTTSYYGESDKIEMKYEYYENGYVKSEVLYDSEGNKTGEVTWDEQGNETYRYPAE